jgi:hypothetical protein
VEDDIDSIFDSDSEYDEDEVVEKQPYNAPRLGKEEIEAEFWKMKTERGVAQGDGPDDTKEAIETNKEDMVRKDFVLISLKAKTKKLDQLADKSVG